MVLTQRVCGRLPVSEQYTEYRLNELRRVYREFDLDGGGDVGEDELLQLGQTRRKLGQKEGTWTVEMNDRLMKKIGMNRNRSLPEDNFVKYFESSLSSDETEFNHTIKQFMECASACRRRKEEKRSGLTPRASSGSSPVKDVVDKSVTASANPWNVPDVPYSSPRKDGERATSAPEGLGNEKAQEAAKKKAEEDARLAAEEAARKKAEEDKRLAAEEAARKKA